MSSSRRNVHALQRSISKDLKSRPSSATESFDENLLTTKSIIMPLKPVNKMGMKGINKLDTTKLASKETGQKGKQQPQRSQSKKSLQKDPEMPLKQSVNSMLHMKREAKKVALAHQGLLQQPKRGRLPPLQHTPLHQQHVQLEELPEQKQHSRRQSELEETCQKKQQTEVAHQHRPSPLQVQKQVAQSKTTEDQKQQRREASTCGAHACQTAS